MLLRIVTLTLALAAFAEATTEKKSSSLDARLDALEKRVGKLTRNPVGKKTSDTGCDDTDNGAKDPYGDTCFQYHGNEGWCGKYDDNDFKSKQMCCACGGGEEVCRNGAGCSSSADCHGSPCVEGPDGMGWMGCMCT